MKDSFPRIERLPPYVFNIVNELKAQARQRGEDVVDFGMGNPDQPTPPHIVEKLVQAARRDDTHRYSVSKGVPRLRRAICAWYKRRYDVDLNPDSEAIVTIGSKEGLAHLALATVGPGDAVLVPNPTYPIHPYGFVIAGADIRHVPMLPELDFFEELETAIRNCWPRPKFLVLNFPSNPTTTCVDLDFFERVVRVAREHEIWVIHDLAYAEIACERAVVEVRLDARQGVDQRRVAAHEADSPAGHVVGLRQRVGLDGDVLGARHLQDGRRLVAVEGDSSPRLARIQQVVAEGSSRGGVAGHRIW